MKQVITGLGICGLLLLIQAVSAVPGDVIWQQTLGGQAGEEWGYSVDPTPDNGVVVTGIAYSEDVNISGAKGNGDLWVVRLGPDGKPLWNHAYGGTGSDYGLSVKTLEDGEYIIVGTTGSNNGDVAGYHDNGDLWVLKLSSSGEPVWKHVYGGNMTDEGGDIIPVSDGGYTLTGYTMSDDGDVTGHHGGGDLWMLHLDQTGSIVWQKTFGGSKRDSGSSIIRTSDGGYAMTGNTYSSDGDVTNGHGSSDLWVVKTDVNGTLLWQKTYGGSKLDWGHSLIELAGGDLMVAGVTASSDGDVHLNHGAGDIWILRLSPQGDLIWEKTYGGNFSDNIWKIEPSPREGAFLTGETYSVDGDIFGNHGDADLWVSEIAGNGTLLWQRTLGGSDYDSGAWCRLMQDGNLTVVGTTQSTDGDVHDVIGNGDLWALKIDAGYNSANTSTQSTSAPQNISTAPANDTQLAQPKPEINSTGNLTSLTPVIPGEMNLTGNVSGLNSTITSAQSTSAPQNISTAPANDTQLAQPKPEINSTGNLTPVIPLIPEMNQTGNVTMASSLPNTSEHLVVNQSLSVNRSSSNSTSVAIQPVQINSSDNMTVLTPSSLNVTQINSTLATNSTESMNPTLISLPGNVQPPGDLNHDGKYEDLNGNGKIDLQDPTIFFNNFEWIKANLPNQDFDFNGNGVLDYGDINALFEEVSR